MRKTNQFGTKPRAIAATVDDRGLFEHLDRIGLGNAFGITLAIFAVIFAANWWVG